MHEIGLSLELQLICCLAGLLIIAFLFISYFFKGKKALLIVLPTLSFITVCSYQQWGGWTAWKQYNNQQVRAQAVKKLLTQFDSPEAIIEKLKQKLTEKPASPQGWYLLGRLYMNQNNWLAARDALVKANQLKPEYEPYMVNYIHVLWNLNKQKFNPEIKRLLNILLQKKPNQPDALALLAMDAYHRQDYQQAINYWQRLLQLVPADSEAAQALHKAIVKAQLKLSTVNASKFVQLL